ncbi:MAG: cobalamin B12-binding domain-containing protein, partial [Candidatus Abyssubacteria bacterium]|nr:cobalamin B12-binding domain-containing protein [Candidatus Abyssubacteria bacterium]
MKVLLVNAPPLRALGITGQIYPPLGILYLASYAREKRAGLEIRAIDGYKEDRHTLVSKIIKLRPRVLGVSFTTQAATGAYRLINEVKEKDKNIYIVAGGAHRTIVPEETLERSMADMVCIGEGEETFFELLEKIDGSEEALTSILGTVVRHNGKIKKN